MRRSTFGVYITLFLLTMYMVTSPRVVAAPEAPKMATGSAALAFVTRPGLPDPNQIFDLVNQARKQNGLRPLIRSVVLTDLAQQRANDMEINDYYSHTSPYGLNFDDILARDGYVFDYGCENLDLESTLAATTFVSDWINSTAGHKECLLNNRVTDAGYAVTTLGSVIPGQEPTYIVIAIHATQPLPN